MSLITSTSMPRITQEHVQGLEFEWTLRPRHNYSIRVYSPPSPFLNALESMLVSSRSATALSNTNSPRRPYHSLTASCTRARTAVSKPQRDPDRTAAPEHVCPPHPLRCADIYALIPTTCRRVGLLNPSRSSSFNTSNERTLKNGDRRLIVGCVQGFRARIYKVLRRYVGTYYYYGTQTNLICIYHITPCPLDDDSNKSGPQPNLAAPHCCYQRLLSRAKNTCVGSQQVRTYVHRRRRDKQRH